MCAITRFEIPDGYSIKDVTTEYARFINNITDLVKGTINEHEFNMNVPFINKFILKMKKMNMTQVKKWQYIALSVAI